MGRRWRTDVRRTLPPPINLRLTQPPNWVCHLAELPKKLASYPPQEHNDCYWLIVLNIDPPATLAAAVVLRGGRWVVAPWSSGGRRHRARWRPRPRRRLPRRGSRGEVRRGRGQSRTCC